MDPVHHETTGATRTACGRRTTGNGVAYRTALWDLTTCQACLSTRSQTTPNQDRQQKLDTTRRTTV